jgi:predicted unusual protein kinase regulating ubiquinone biosynthesis (AarF/ABC1/UbiB family)
MPIGQLDEVLTRAWGAGWDARFAQFSFTPIAAASIGQVHRATTKDGRQLAVKVQYPGIRQSIDSDVDNVGTLLRVSGLLPAHLNVAPLLEEAKKQLHEEADYLREARCQQQFGALLGNDAALRVPTVHADWTTDNVLAMDYVECAPIESLQRAPQAQRDSVASLLIGLLFRELFEFHLVQTDPNFANYRFDAASGRTVLLDFGATRSYGPGIVEAYRQLMRAAMHADRQGVDQAATAIGYFGSHIRADQREAVIDLFTIACEPLRCAEAYDFGRSDLPQRIRAAGMALSTQKDFWHTPPADALFLHRKLGGLYLLAARLQAQVPVQALARPYLDAA